MADTENENPIEQDPVEDPLDVATALLYETLGTLQESCLSEEKREAARNVLLVAQTTALIDIARSVRVIAAWADHANI